MLIDKNYTAFVSSTPISAANTNTSAQTGQTKNSDNEDFKQLLEQELQKSSESLSFSKHALQRINERQIEIEPKLLEQVSNAVDSAAEKGIKDALILGPQTAFIVNVPSKTVITTMNSQDMKDNIITNIDGTVII